MQNLLLSPDLCSGQEGVEDTQAVGTGHDRVRGVSCFKSPCPTSGSTIQEPTSSKWAQGLTGATRLTRLWNASSALAYMLD